MRDPGSSKVTGVLAAGAGSQHGATLAVALYEQVKMYVTRKIQDGSWPAGHRLPSEQSFVTQFGISRMTIHRALRELVEQGRIVRVCGVGSFVAADKPQSTLLHIANIANEIRQRGHDYACRMLTVETVAAPSEVGVLLDLPPGSSLFHTICLHLENQVPVQLEDRYVNPRIVPAYLQQDFSRTTPSEYLMRQVPYDHIEHVVDAVLPNTEQAADLEMSAHGPCLLLTRRTWSKGIPVTLVRCLHPASRYRLGSRFRVDGTANAG